MRESEKEAVRLITARLQTRSRAIFRASHAPIEARESSWTFWRSTWLRPAALALSGIVLVVVLSLQLWNRPPALRPPSPDHEVLRSNGISVIAPTGDIARPPDEIQWQAVPNAAKYEIRLLEVDETELWKAEITGTIVSIPPTVRDRIVPAKTLLWSVSAFDRSGHLIAQSEAVRFRVLQRVYKP